MQTEKVIKHITEWLKSYSEKSKTEGFVVGISGGIDSAVTSTLCTLTGKPVICLNMPIHQHKSEYDRGKEHISWLRSNHQNVSSLEVDLSAVFDLFVQTLPEGIRDHMTLANARARFRMTTLYAFAGHHKMIVAGTGNKIEDFGIGFFTKYGDGGVDVSPIADLLKSEVYEIAKALNVPQSIRVAKPTDGLFHDSRSDEDQIGASYDELEWAMQYVDTGSTSVLNERQKEVISIYKSRNAANRHKMEPIPVCTIPANLRA